VRISRGRLEKRKGQHIKETGRSGREQSEIHSEDGYGGTEFELFDLYNATEPISTPQNKVKNRA
jgi:hypothetical protein